MSAFSPLRPHTTSIPIFRKFHRPLNVDCYADARPNAFLKGVNMRKDSRRAGSRLTSCVHASVQLLETRRLLSTLDWNGTDAADIVRLNVTATNIIITAQNQPTVNVPSIAFDAVSFNLRGGDDQLVIETFRSERVSILGGDGSDVVFFGSPTFGLLNLNGGNIFFDGGPGAGDTLVVTDSTSPASFDQRDFTVSNNTVTVGISGTSNTLTYAGTEILRYAGGNSPTDAFVFNPTQGTNVDIFLTASASSATATTSTAAISSASDPGSPPAPSSPSTTQAAPSPPFAVSTSTRPAGFARSA
jgi:hypothetical protein